MNFSGMMNRNKNSMLYWYPKIKDLDIPQPRTEFVELTEKEKKAYYEGEGLFSDTLTQRVRECIEKKFTLPIFLRTDQQSGKHFWKKTCFVSGLTSLKEHICEITSFTRCCDIFGGLPIEAMVIREFIPMDTMFTAFLYETPINPEIRFFVENGEVKCWHWYWCLDAIEEGEPSVPNWRELMNKTKDEISGNDILWLTDEVKKIAEVFKDDDFWSVDFCRAKDKKYYLIDLALGEQSWHPKDCPFNRTIEVNLFKDAKPMTDADVKFVYEEEK
jgi:hypothetical protein